MFHVCLEYVQHLCNAALSPVKMFWQLAILLPTVNYLLPCSPICLNKLILVPWTKLSCLLLLFLLCFLACFEQENIWTELLPKCTLLRTIWEVCCSWLTKYIFISTLPVDVEKHSTFLTLSKGPVSLLNNYFRYYSVHVCVPGCLNCAIFRYSLIVHCMSVICLFVLLKVAIKVMNKKELGVSTSSLQIIHNHPLPTVYWEESRQYVDHVLYVTRRTHCPTLLNT